MSKNIKPKLFFILIISIFLLQSCSKTSSIKILYNIDNQINASASPEFSLIPLNNSAKQSEIISPSKSSYLYYGFSDQLLALLSSNTFDVMPSIELSISISDFEKNIVSDDNNKKIIPAFAVSLLHDNDFTDKQKLNKILSDRPLVKGSLADFSGENFIVSLALSSADLKTVRGFAIYSTAPLKMESACLRPAALGWDISQKGSVSEKSHGLPFGGWYGFGPDGGTLVYSEYMRVDFSSGVHVFKKGLPPKITVKLAELSGGIGSYESQLKVNLTIGNPSTTDDSYQTIVIRRAPNQNYVSVNTAAIQNRFSPIFVTQNAQMVKSLIMESVFEPKISSNKDEIDFRPIPCDPGLVLDWNTRFWRNSDFEIYSWEQFPNILMFDFASLDIQNSFLNRLAFFVEKTGFRGRLVTDEEVANIHGYNAHDYAAEDLANFFDLARKTNFPLNENELLLREILIDNGIIIDSKNQYIKGSGSIVSMSQESPSYLRSTFSAHENMHGLYFIDTDFQKFVTEVFNSTDEKTLEFLMEYFTKTPSLNYDVTYQFLLENEFMGYLMQQPLSNVASYFAKNIAMRYSVNKDFPELAKYVRDTEGKGFYESAYKIAHYLFDRWGLAAGRSFLVSVE